MHSPTTFVCHCNNFFYEKRMYDRHMRHFHNSITNTVTKTEHRCQKCGLVFDQSHALKLHVNDMHNGKGKGLHCDLNLESPSSLGAYIYKGDHEGDKTYACQICGKKFKSQHNALVHVMNSHEYQGQSYNENAISEKKDWNIENESMSSKMLNANTENDWQIHDENLDSNNVGVMMKNILRHQMKIEFDDDQGYTLKEVLLSPNQSYNVEITKEVKLEHM